MSGRELADMDALARKALDRLLKSANKHEAGVAVRRPALTGAALTAYRNLRNLKDKENFEAVMDYAQAEGAIKLQRPQHDPQGFIDRIELVDVNRLAALLGEVPYATRVQAAKDSLAAHADDFPVLHDVVACWDKLKKVRGTGPDEAAAWAMACDTVIYCRAQVALGVMETPVRDASSRLFKDSKRIERLVTRLDVLLAGTVEDEVRSEAEVLQELGLYREPQPVRMAGDIVIRRERGAFALDRPYSGLPSSTVLGLGSMPSRVLTIENQTTFHVWARQHCDSDVLCLYTAGMPSPAWLAMYVRLLAELPPSTAVSHWGDVDEGGYRIAAFLSRSAAKVGHTLLPWKMRPSDVPHNLRRDASAPTIERMVKYAREAGWEQIAQEVVQTGIVAEQEG